MHPGLSFAGRLSLHCQHNIISIGGGIAAGGTAGKPVDPVVKPSIMAATVNTSIRPRSGSIPIRRNFSVKFPNFMKRTGLANLLSHLCQFFAEA
jgi:hypothetical protein